MVIICIDSEAKGVGVLGCGGGCMLKVQTEPTNTDDNTALHTYEEVHQSATICFSPTLCLLSTSNTTLTDY